MSFGEGVQIDPGRASGGGRGRGIAIGGGAGGLLLVVVALILGVDPGTVLGGGSDPGTGGGATQDFSHCRTGADANEFADCRIIATAESLDEVWADLLPAAGGPAYVPPGLVIFDGQVSTGCGAASSEVGPFYCPADQTTYFDVGFFDVLRDRLGAGQGPLAEEFVVAHEFGHHIEHQLGVLERGRSQEAGAGSAAVRVELMADCLAGVWAHHAVDTVDPESGEPFLEPLDAQDVADALSAAAAVGDDRIQARTQGQVTPETWTHGSSEQRQAWFTRGYEGGDPDTCDTFAAGAL